MTDPYSLAGKRVWVAGSRGMVGGALVRRLEREPCTLIRDGRDRVDLTRQADVEAFVAAEKPDAVFVAAAKVGGIHANSHYPADFLYDNLMIEANILHTCARVGVEKLLFLGSSCIYPREAPQPIREDALLTGPLEPTNEWYAIAKIAGIKLCQAYRAQHGCAFISAMPTNLYGPGDNFHPENSHVPAALLRRIHEAKMSGAPEVVVWGTGTPRREFLHVDDLADACVFLMRHYAGADPINVGTGEDLSISAFAETIRDTVGYTGALTYDTRRPDGTPRKVMDVSRLTDLGWTARTSLREGLAGYYAWFLEHIDRVTA
ncbi:GDP-L-fucose synthase [Roseospira marina]|uniref:GDP-L-fucose synthase n=1 Tax=Roseospira marina TaxID=140057 RepID=A0A5M6IF67_9PROT|nr:GDP-L-fucose synthase [Roseospira marina]KAA5606921.1 GDP-L-fucose synthase [Roseospira marina]MBB4312908.1 GDP-L-fucose synthase [Roseospira marina]MBB5086319.1 GDP-L-fucose synthase [Roseospira marina]